VIDHLTRNTHHLTKSLTTVLSTLETIDSNCIQLYLGYCSVVMTSEQAVVGQRWAEYETTPNCWLACGSAVQVQVLTAASAGPYTYELWVLVDTCRGPRCHLWCGCVPIKPVGVRQHETGDAAVGSSTVWPPVTGR
jgi:hypothetical protein